MSNASLTQEEEDALFGSGDPGALADEPTLGELRFLLRDGARILQQFTAPGIWLDVPLVLEP